MNWLVHVLGMDSGSGYWYLWWSGVGANLGEFAILGGMINVARHHNCHVHRCWRVGRHHVAGTNYICCRKHTPGGAPTHSDVLNAYSSAFTDEATR